MASEPGNQLTARWCCQGPLLFGGIDTAFGSLLRLFSAWGDRTEGERGGCQERGIHSRIKCLSVGKLLEKLNWPKELRGHG